MEIQKHLLLKTPFVPSPNRGGEIKPEFIVFHYTASWSAKSAISTLTDPKSKASAHVVVDTDGTITQLVPFNQRAWHAGPSEYGEYRNLNNHSIGIEIVNIGWLRKTTAGYMDPYGRLVSEDYASKLTLVEFQNSALGPGKYYQPIYPEVQLRAIDKLVDALLDTYKIEQLVTHEEIDSRGWKTDPGPAFPMSRYRSKRNSRVGARDAVTLAVLNVRSGPGTDFSVVRQLPRFAEIEVENTVGDWHRIADGWISKSYVEFKP